MSASVPISLDLLLILRVANISERVKKIRNSDYEK